MILLLGLSTTNITYGIQYFQKTYVLYIYTVSHNSIYIRFEAELCKVFNNFQWKI